MGERSTKLAMLIMFLVLIVPVGGFFYLRGATYDTHLTVRTIYWQRILSVERMTALRKDTSRYQMPADAYNVDYYVCSHYVSMTCRTGFGKDTRTYECGHTAYDDMARYTINRWVWAYDLTTTGGRNDERVYPDFIAKGSGELGSERESGRREILWVRFNSTDHAPLDYQAPDADTWRDFAEGQGYTVKINRLENILWDTLKRQDNR